jgi:3-hydroxyisobutyrate dehydrogenase
MPKLFQLELFIFCFLAFCFMFSRRLLRYFSSTVSRSNVGFIGLGNMGSSMATNLLKKYPNLKVFDILKDNVVKLTSIGAHAAISPVQLAKECNVIVIMVPATQHVIGLLRGPNGIFNQAQPGTLIIDSSTIDPITSKELIQEARSRNLKMIDAPVSGGVTGAAAGTLTFMVGGSLQDFDEAKV